MNGSDEVNENCVQLLLTDADLALTFIQVADTSNDGSRIEAAVQNARKAYKYISEKRLKFRFSLAQAQTLEEKLQLLRSDLTRLGAILD